MIYVNNQFIADTKFPDNTLSLKMEIVNDDSTITWLYSGDEEMVMLSYITKHIQSKGYKVALKMPYIPNARMDRAPEDEDIFTLKYFCQFINSLNFTYVEVLDAHSNVALALIDRVRENPFSPYIYNTLTAIVCHQEGSCFHEDREFVMNNLLMFYPDEGAMKRYSKVIKLPYSFGIKHRDWKTSKIISYSVIEENPIKGKDILIIDDICSKGGTFIMAATELKKLGARNIYLYVTHCEENIKNGDILKTDLIEKVYTTNSIAYRMYNEPKINIIGDVK